MAAINPHDPPIYAGPADWRGAEMRANEEWIYELSDADRAELHDAAKRSESEGVALTALSRDTFPLPEFATRLEALQNDLIHGRGFFLLRGIPIDGLPRERVARIYLGLGHWIGDPVSQNAQGHLLGHVRDIGNDPGDPSQRIYTTNFRQLFHTDSCDIVGLLCLQPAMRGGASAISSSTAVYNEVARGRPDLAEVLAQPFVIDRKGEIPKGQDPTYEMPIVHHHAGLLSVIYARDFIEAAQRRFAEVPRLTAEQTEAVDLFDQLAASDEFRLDMDFRPGDLQFLHNHQILHARTAYEDHPEPHRKRHLLRLWLSARNGRPLPDVYSRRYGEIRVGKRRGGIFVPGAALCAPLEAE